MKTTAYLFADKETKSAAQEYKITRMRERFNQFNTMSEEEADEIKAAFLAGAVWHEHKNNKVL